MRITTTDGKTVTSSTYCDVCGKYSTGGDVCPNCLSLTAKERIILGGERILNSDDGED